MGLLTGLDGRRFKRDDLRRLEKSYRRFKKMTRDYSYEPSYDDLKEMTYDSLEDIKKTVYKNDMVKKLV